MPTRRNRMLVGNPGKGKSTLLNAMIGEVIFRSGFSAGTGLSAGLDKHSRDGENFFDTPGLDDPQKREVAAKSIEEALKQDGIYSILFVVTLEAGRVNTKDAATMKTVLKACPTIGNRYGLIINKVKPKTVPKVLGSLGVIKSVLYCDASIPSTDHIFVNPNDDDLEDEADKLAELSPEFRDFLDKSPQIVIEPKAVAALDIRDWEEQAEEMEKKMKSMSQDNEKLQARLKELLAEHKQRMVMYNHWDDRVNRYEGNNDMDTWGKYNGGVEPGSSRIIINKDANSIEKKDGPVNDYMRMCVGDAIDRGELSIPGGHHVVWHWDEKAQHAAFSSETDAAIRFGQITTGASRLLILNGRVSKDEGPSNHWKQAAKGALLIRP